MPIGRPARGRARRLARPERPAGGVRARPRWARRATTPRRCSSTSAAAGCRRQGAWAIVRRLRRPRRPVGDACRPTCCATRAPPTCSTTAPTSGSCRSCSATRRSRRPRCTRRSPPSGSGRSTTPPTPGPGGDTPVDGSSRTRRVAPCRVPGPGGRAVRRVRRRADLRPRDRVRPAIVVVHGGPDFDHAYLLPDLDRLADEFRLVYYDQRGRGRSTAGVRPAAVTMQTEVDDLDAVRAACGDEVVAVLGHSWGALLAMAYAIRHPDRLSHLILLNPAPASAVDAAVLRRAWSAARTAEQTEAMAALRRAAATGLATGRQTPSTTASTSPTCSTGLTAWRASSLA